MNYNWSGFIEQLSEDLLTLSTMDDDMIRANQEIVTAFQIPEEYFKEDYMSEENPKTSPTVKKAPRDPNSMDFPDALRQVIDGKSITKQEWNDPSVIVKIVSDRLMIKLDDGKFHPLIVSYGDLHGDDWVVLA
jgi:signal transduction histidine kinase